MKKKLTYAVYEVVYLMDPTKQKYHVFTPFEKASYDEINRLRPVKRISSYTGKKTAERRVRKIKRKLKEIEILNKLEGRT